MTRTSDEADIDVLDVATEWAPPVRRPSRKRRLRTSTRLKWLALGSVSVVLLLPLYIMVISAFKQQEDILGNPLGIGPGSFTLDPLTAALGNPNFNVLRAYATTLLFVVLVNVFSIALSAPISYVIARGRTRWHVLLLMVFVCGLFVPPQVILIPVVFVLRELGLIGTIPGFVLFETAGTLPVTIFLFTAFVRSIPREIDEAAALDGAGRIRTFWSCIFPLMKPVVLTIIVLHSIGVWNDFINPQVILGPGSGYYTVTTGVYAAVSELSTDYTVVFPTLLLAVAPALVFFFVMQRFIIGGLVAGSTKG
jgi:raffinose/stachyose/melibiose transport system permease protein